MQTSFNLSIGMGEEAAPEPTSYTRISFDFQLHKQKIHDLTQELRQKTGIYRVPTLVMDFPESMKNFPLPFFQDSPNKVKCSVIQKGNRVFKCLDIIDQEFRMTRKKFQKLLGKLTQLDNNIFLHIDLYNVDTYYQRFQNKENLPICTFMQKSKISANLSLDPQFWNMFEELTRKIAPKFADSPVMAMIPMFGSLDCDIQMDSLADLQQNNKEELFGFKRFQEPDDDEEGKILKSNFNNKQKIIIYACLENLGFLKFEIEARMFALYACMS